MTERKSWTFRRWIIFWLNCLKWLLKVSLWNKVFTGLRISDIFILWKFYGMAPNKNKLWKTSCTEFTGFSPLCDGFLRPEIERFGDLHDLQIGDERSPIPNRTPGTFDLRHPHPRHSIALKASSKTKGNSVTKMNPGSPLSFWLSDVWAWNSWRSEIRYSDFMQLH